LKPSIENCGQTAADGDMVTIDSLQEVVSAFHSVVPSSSPPYDSPFSRNTARLAYHSALWPFKVIQSRWLSCHLKANMRLPISDQ